MSACDRIAHYIAMRDAMPLRQARDCIHGIHTGTQWEAELCLSDLRALPAEVAALRAELAEMTEAKNAHITFQNYNAKLVQARDDEIAALKREVERLREALEPLVEHAQEVDHDYYGLQSCEGFDVAEAIDTARAALAVAEEAGAGVFVVPGEAVCTDKADDKEWAWVQGVNHHHALTLAGRVTL